MCLDQLHKTYHMAAMTVGIGTKLDSKWTDYCKYGSSTYDWRGINDL